ncbi:MAG: hypothetical protein JSW20_13305 [Nitrospiraceae bacterium]|jgi:hypothetical protein|nr:MAG: hypothetical protein JSW20_13305 [Nitrospiraceae bacterium]
MKGTKRDSAYEQYKNEQVAWASAEDLMLIMAKELIRLKDDTGMNLFFDDSEEELMRAYIKNSEALAQS